MRKLYIYFLMALSVISVIGIADLKKATAEKDSHISTAKQLTYLHQQSFACIKKHAAILKSFAIANNSNHHYGFLIDMRMPSGNKRFFVYDFKNDLIVCSGLVTHGSGSNIVGPDSLIFSNTAGSNCSSLGIYKVGKPYFGKFGLAYKLHGLQQTNSNAYLRNVVLHAHPFVPDREIAPLKICRSWGCPTVSPLFLKQLKTYLDQPGADILLSIFY
ncbi:MAG: murein L,D-transpeptidase catalytic domain-containing protein [Ferruginibacter sp.]